MEVIEILTSSLVTYIIAAVLVFTQLLKPYITERFIPLVGFTIGALLTFVIFGFQVNVILPAILIGGASLGLYDIGKKTVLGK
jgi:hypothetical protein